MKYNQFMYLVLFILMNYSFTFSQAQNSQVTSAVEFYKQRERATQLVKNKQWKEAETILESLIYQYKNDADLYYLLGISAYQINDYTKSINAFKKCLEKGGTILREIPTGSAPSNDIMIKIAKAYALSGDKINSITWIEKAFKNRYDEKPFIGSSSAFKVFKNDVNFQKTIGTYKKENQTREEAWIQDINYFINNIKQSHYNMYHSVSKENFETLVNDVKSNINTLTDQQVIVKLMKILGSLGNGHNLIIPTTPKQNALKQLPVQFYQFKDGMYIVSAKKGFKKWIGYKVISIGNNLINEALIKTNKVNARDNNMQTLWLGPYYLSLPDVLKELGITNSSKEVTLELEDNSGVKEKIKLRPQSWNFSDFPKIPKVNTENQPLYLSKMKDPYWSKTFSTENAIYVQFNVVAEKKSQSIQAFTEQLRIDISDSKTKYLILDLRHNHGGNGSLLKPMLQTIINFEVTHPKGKIFVLIGRETFSAAQNLLTDITKYTNAVLVGEPSGSKPNHIGEANWFKLPYSGLMGLISSQYHQTSKAEDHRKWIAPHIPVEQSSKDYFKGKDKALQIVFKTIASLK